MYKKYIIIQTKRSKKRSVKPFNYRFKIFLMRFICSFRQIVVHLHVKPFASETADKEYACLCCGLTGSGNPSVPRTEMTHCGR